MYFVLLISTLVISGLATLYVKGMISKYSRVPASSGYSGAQTAQRILQMRGIHDVTVLESDGMMGDHYNPVTKQLVLSRDVYEGTSTAAVGIAAHECGHAIQHQEAYAPLQLRSSAVGLTQFANQIMFLPFIFMFMHIITPYTGLLIISVAMGIIMVFNLVTLPVEYDASRRAKAILPELGIIRGPAEARAVAKVLDAAALTYLAAFLTSLAYFLYYILQMQGGGSSRR